MIDIALISFTDAMRQEITVPLYLFLIVLLLPASYIAQILKRKIGDKFDI